MTKQPPAPNKFSNSFLNERLGKPVTVELSSAVIATGVLKSFDAFCLIVETQHGEACVFKGGGVVVR